MTENIAFTVILPVFHSGHFLDDALQSLRYLDYPPECFEVLVAGRENDQEAQAIVRRCAEVSRHRLRFIGRIASRRAALLNAACREARGRILVFADDDCLFLPDWLNQYQSAFAKNPAAGIIGGPDEPQHAGLSFNFAMDAVLQSPLVRGRFPGSGNSRIVKYYPKLFNMAILRELALRVSPVDKDGTPLVFADQLAVHEEVELAERIQRTGKALVLAPEARVKHCRDTTFADFVVRNFFLGRACRQLNVHRFPQTTLSLFVFGMVLLALAALAFAGARPAFFLYAGGYLLILIVSGIQSYRKTGKPAVLLLVPLLLAALHVSRGFGHLLARRL
jgi:GT2 family glycosyltransferase